MTPSLSMTLRWPAEQTKGRLRLEADSAEASAELGSMQGLTPWVRIESLMARKMHDMNVMLAHSPTPNAP